MLPIRQPPTQRALQNWMLSCPSSTLMAVTSGLTRHFGVLRPTTVHGKVFTALLASWEVLTFQVKELLEYLHLTFNV
jgi:hypothetical protein